MNAGWHRLLGQRWVQALVFSIVYILVDALSFIHPVGQLNITPWNPPAALLVLFIGWRGVGAMPWAYLTLLVSDEVVRASPPLSGQVLLGNAVLVLCYAGVARALSGWWRARAAASQRRQIAGMSLIVACGALFTGAVYIGLLHALGLMPEVSYLDALYRFFIGDLLGMMVPLPLAFLLLDARRGEAFLALLRQPSFWGLLSLLLLCLALILALPQDERLQYFFPVFLIVGVLAVTHSLPGASLACLLVQLLLVYSASHDRLGLDFLLDMQWVILTLNLTGLLIGTVVEERREAEERLRESLQLVAAGQLAGALAHELHQPLSALNAYAASALLLGRGDVPGSAAGSTARLDQVLHHIADETARASEVVRSLRRYFTAGESRLQRVSVESLVNDCLQRWHTQAQQAGVVLHCELSALPPLHVDPVQMGTALGNLLKNAIEASQRGQTVSVLGRWRESGWVELRVCDEGTPLSAAEARQVFRPFYSDKLHGLGLGLSISRSLVENNGGRLIYDNQPQKSFVMLLPSADPADV